MTDTGSRARPTFTTPLILYITVCLCCSPRLGVVSLRTLTRRAASRWRDGDLCEVMYNGMPHSAIINEIYEGPSGKAFGSINTPAA
jgi:hypothetical protein